VASLSIALPIALRVGIPSWRSERRARGRMSMV
jgi:hypothetical protein